MHPSTVAVIEFPGRPMASINFDSALEDIEAVDHFDAEGRDGLSAGFSNKARVRSGKEK